MPRPRPAALAALLALALSLSACSDVEGTGDLQWVQGDGSVVEVPQDERAEPVDVDGETLDGEVLDLADFRGKVVVVNVWGSWCTPCRAETPMLVDAAAAVEPDGAEFVGIDIRDVSRENAQAFEREFGVDYPSLYDPGSETLLGFGRYAPSAPPATVFLDREGRVAALINGPIPSKSTVTTIVADLLEESDG